VSAAPGELQGIEPIRQRLRGLGAGPERQTHVSRRWLQAQPHPEVAVSTIGYQRAFADFGGHHHAQEPHRAVQMALLPAYSPDLNRAEYLWAWLKRHAFRELLPEVSGRTQDQRTQQATQRSRSRQSIFTAC
jgi:hypothetical protein